VNSNRIVSQAQKESKPHIKLLKELIGLTTARTSRNQKEKKMPQIKKKKNLRQNNPG
jgi:hypothetical protein